MQSHKEFPKGKSNKINWILKERKGIPTARMEIIIIRIKMSVMVLQGKNPNNRKKLFKEASSYHKNSKILLLLLLLLVSK